MKILIHTDRGKEKAGALAKQVQDRLPDIRIHSSHGMRALIGELKQPLNNISVIIIFVQTLDGLNNLFTLKSFFDNKKLILVLPNRDNQTVARGLELNPSFISTTDKGEEDVLMVLKQIRRRHQSMPKI